MSFYMGGNACLSITGRLGHTGSYFLALPDPFIHFYNPHTMVPLVCNEVIGSAST